MLTLQSDLHGNWLLSALPADEWVALAKDLEFVHLRAGQVLHDYGKRLHHVYFPTSAVISIQSEMSDGFQMELAMIGREGMTGVEPITTLALVQQSGSAYRISAESLKYHAGRAGVFQRLMALYPRAFLAQVMRNAVCSHHHSLMERLCRWLLDAADRTGSDELCVTQQFIADMLGMRREGVTAVTGVLKQAGVIECTRGHVAIADRPKLESRACECYQAMKGEFTQWLPAKRASELAA